MRRIVAYSYDLLIASPIVLGFWYTAEIITQSAIDYKAFYLIFFPCLISIFEYYYDGKTPGKFVMRLNTVSEINQRLSLITYYKRSALITYFYPVIFIFIVVIYEIFLKVSLHGLAPYYSMGVFLAFLAVPAIITLGSQCGHDYVFKTAVVSDSNKKIRKFREKYANIIFILLIIVITGSVYSININRDRVTNIVAERGYIDEVSRSELEMSDLIPDTYILERNVENLFEYYDDLHGYIGVRELGEVDRNIGIQTPPVFTFTLNEPRYIPVYRVFVTSKGLLNNRFMETVTRNILEFSIDKTGNAICMVEFIHQDNYFGLFYLLVKRTQVGVHTGILEGSKYNSSMVLTPENGRYISFSDTEIPIWMIE